MNVLCEAGIHRQLVKERETPKFNICRCELCGAEVRKYKPGEKPKGLKRRFRHGRWITTVKR